MIQVAGKLTVPVAGTPEQLFALLDQTRFRFKTFQSVLLQAIFSNTGKIYIGEEGMNKTTFENCAAVLVIPSASGIPSFGASNPVAPAGIDLTALYLDADVSGEGVLCTLLVS